MRTNDLRRGGAAATGHLTASGDTTLVAAPGAGRRIVVSYLSNQNNTTTDITVITKAGATAIDTLLLDTGVRGRVLTLSGEDAWSQPENSAQIQNLSAAGDVLYTVRWFVESTEGI